MKKIIAILVSFLFVASTIGFASARPESDFSTIDCCDPANFEIDKTSVRVGETFTVSFNSFCIPQIKDEDQEEFIEKINFKIYDSNGNITENFDPRIDDEDWPALPGGPDIWWDWTYKAVKPGKVDFVTSKTCKETVTITSRALPMDKFMKFFGLGKKD